MKRLTAVMILASQIGMMFPVPVYGTEAPGVLPGLMIPAEGESVSEVVEPGTGSTLRLGEAELEIPAGAVKEAVEIRITELRRTHELDEGMANVTGGTAGYRFEPRGMVFEKDVVVRIPYSEDIAESEMALENLYTYFYNEDAGHWETLERVEIDRDRRVIASVTTHFTEMINSTLTLPEGPSPIEFDPTTIKNLEAANPGSGVVQAEVQGGSVTGELGFRIKLNVPAGRNGMTPEVAVQYSSEGQSGLIGRGFDLSVGAITTDTRFGMPKYDGSDRYYYRGEELAAVESRSDEIEYRPVVEQGFERIVRNRAGNYWSITDKSGTVREYGRDEGWIGPARGNRGKVFTWYLTREKDMWGNTVEYGYRYDSVNRYTYLDKIVYTGRDTGNSSEREEGVFEIRFGYAERQDRRIDGRGGFVSKQGDRLERVTIWYRPGNRAVRSYWFEGDYNEFGQRVLKRFAEKSGDGSREWYAYEMDYYGLAKHGDGYDGFDTSRMWTVENGSKFDGISAQTSANFGGSTTGGIKLYGPKFWFPGWGVLAETSVSVGFGGGLGGTINSIVDVNGDGLPDLVRRDQDKLYVSFNNGNGGFSDNKALPGLGESIDNERRSYVSFGAKATLNVIDGVQVGAAGTTVTTTSKTLSGFMDVDGDGYVDFVRQGRRFDRNQGGRTGFLAQSWVGLDGINTPVQPITDDEKEDNDKSFYVQEPVRAWSAWRTGTISVSERGTLKNDTRSTEIRLDSYRGNSKLASIPLAGSGGQVSGTAVFTAAVEPTDRLYFHQNTGNDNEHGAVDWGITIKYTNLRLFENLGKGLRYRIPQVLVSKPPQQLLDNEYYKEVSGDTKTYSRQVSDETLTAYVSTNSELKAWAVKNRYFIVDTVPAELYKKILQKARPASVSDEDNPNTEAEKAYQRLYFGYEYEAEFERYIRVDPAKITGTDNDSKKVRDLLNDQTGVDNAFISGLQYLSESELLQIARIAGVDDDGEAYPYKDGSTGYSYRRTAAALQKPQEIIKEGAVTKYQSGVTVENLGVLLETRNAPYGGGIERLWLRKKAGDTYGIFFESNGVTREITAKTVSETQAIFMDYGVERTFLLQNKKSDLATIPDSIYQELVYPKAVEGKTFSEHSYSAIPGSIYAALRAVFSDEYIPARKADKVIFADAYEIKTRTEGSGENETTIIEYKYKGDGEDYTLADIRLMGENAKASAGISETINYSLMKEEHYTKLLEKLSGDYLVYLPSARNIFTGAYERTEEIVTVPGGEGEEPEEIVAVVYVYTTVNNDYPQWYITQLLTAVGESVADSGRIPEEDWSRIVAKLAEEDKHYIPSDQEVFESYYEIRDGLYILKDTVTRDETEWVLEYVKDTAAAGTADGLLRLMAGSPDLRVLTLSAADYNILTGIAKTDVRNCFVRGIPESGDGYYYVKTGLPEESAAALREAMRYYYFVYRAFPYYDYVSSEGIWQLKSGLDPAGISAVKAIIEELKLDVLTVIQRSNKYNSQTAHTVYYGSDGTGVALPGGSTKLSMDPYSGTLGMLGSTSGEKVGQIAFPGINGSGEIVWKHRYVHIFETGKDFSAENISAPPEPEETKNAWLQGKVEPENVVTMEHFVGGVYGWYYGLWTGYYTWDVNNIGQAPTVDKNKVKEGRATDPIFFSIMTRNREETGDAEKQLQTTGSGADEVAVPEDALVGPVASAVTSEMDDEMNITTRTRYYGAVVYRNNLYPNVNAGDSEDEGVYDGSPAIGSSGLTRIRRSKSKTKDYFLGVNPPTLNDGTSRQTEGLMDINGDRYPDMVVLEWDNSGNNIVSWKVYPGTGTGFGPAETYTPPKNNAYLSSNETKSYGMGASPGDAIGSMMATFKGGGNMSAVSGNESSSDSASFSISFNGSAGVSTEEEGLMDINGDGLPDYVVSQGSTMDVYLNLGDGTFSEKITWRNTATNTNALSIRFNGATETETARGLSQSLVGSVSGSIGFGTDIVVANSGIGASVTKTVMRFADMNGDGLADLVIKRDGDDYFLVRFNLGDEFMATPVKIYRPNWGSEIGDYAFDLGNELGQLLKNSLAGVGLPSQADFVTKLIPSGVLKLPTIDASNPIVQSLNPTQIDDDLEYSSGFNISLGGGVNIQYRLFYILAFFFNVGVNGSVANTSVNIKFMDIDGDGLPDHVLRIPYSRNNNHGKIYVKRNTLAEVGLLKGLTLPMGGSYNFAYERTENSEALPQSRWVVTEITKRAGNQPSGRGVSEYTERYTYENGYYDRARREFYGFGKVTAERGDGTTMETEYYTPDIAGADAYYLRRQPKQVTVRDGARDLQQTVYTTTAKNVGSYSAIKFPAMESRTVRTWGSTGSGYTQQTVTYTYEMLYGNVVKLQDLGDTRGSDGTVIATIEYDNPTGGYLHAHPERITVTDGFGRVLRKREGDYNSKGELTNWREYYESSKYIEYILTRDKYGNLASITDPRGSERAYTYDPVTHSLPASITVRNGKILGTHAYTSRSTWLPEYGAPETQTDANGRTMTYTYDERGRLSTVKTPHDTNGIPAVSYEYLVSGGYWTAVTYNKIGYDSGSGEVMRTVLYTDGLGRIIQTGKDGEFTDKNGNRRTGWNISGAVVYDSKARVIEEGQTQFSATMSQSELPGIAEIVRPTKKSYDGLDRILRVELPGAADKPPVITTIAYEVRNNRQYEISRDPLGNVTERSYDERGNISLVRRLDSIGNELMKGSYKYDLIGQLLEARDSLGGTVQVTYDLAGRRLTLTSPDTGTVESTYDESGNLIRRVDSQLKADGKDIWYEYDGLNRLVKIKYPTSEAVTYTYGDESAKTVNGAGRIIKQTDGTGSIEYKYGILGEVTEKTREIKRLESGRDPLKARFRYRGNYLGQLEWIEYPDLEVVRYGYDTGGQIQSVSSTKESLTTEYVKTIGYDEYGQRTYIEYGNGVRTSYTYDENRRWLDSIRTSHGAYGPVYQNMAYEFDEVGNVKGYINQSYGYEVTQQYTYDNLYQLTKADGTTRSMMGGSLEDYRSTYSQEFDYDVIGNMVNKRSTSTVTPWKNIGDDLNYTLDYEYIEKDGIKSHQAKRIGDRYYSCDLNGNIVEVREGGNREEAPKSKEPIGKDGSLRWTEYGMGLDRGNNSGGGSSGGEPWSRQYVWDEENRLIKSTEGTLVVTYSYGADGQRAVKYSSRGETVYFDSMWQVMATSNRRSKHIYVGTERIATRLGEVNNDTIGFNKVQTYYYHSDHIGSAQFVTDYQGDEYERIEYTPYGELWVEKTTNGVVQLPFRFTGKELDEETGLYYYGARYLDPKTSQWLSADPALGEYLPGAPTNKQARERNANLPGMGGVFNLVNLQLYHYAGNNPVKYTDPDGRSNDKGPLGFKETWDAFVSGSKKARSEIVGKWFGKADFEKNKRGFSFSYNKKLPFGGEINLHIEGGVAPQIPESDKKEIAQHSYDGGHGPEVNLENPTVDGIMERIDEILTDPNTEIGIGVDKGTKEPKIGYLADDGTLIIHNPTADDKGTAFYDPNGTVFYKDFTPID
ncbi:toxin TcdB middle/N-terminal domain-containing protein [Breznakiella homolactica]|uniref:VCBS repeat-containing protein n=1 Tax=Breznakiella homolactica TaxID=2798577 RepID=A0A7T7XQX1_9SPIR|nr:toxin TcdB middle/N-terminal domain-containing protein [Breznakiella homolactica]QQO10753.1 FG-GAP-like repeat-containing protein [Breznakiella homolactica]